MKYSARRLSYFSFLVFLFCISCLEEIDNLDKLQKTTLRPIVDIPLVNSEFTMKDFLTEGKSKAKISEQNGVMVLLYKDSIETPSGDKYFTLPNQQSPVVSIDGPAVSFPSPGATVTITKNATFSFAPSQGEVLDSILAKSGDLAIAINSTFPANIALTVSIPSIKIAKIGYQKDFAFAGSGAQSSNVDLQNSKIDLTGSGGSTNTITFSITAKITDTGQPINSTHHLNFNFGLTNLKFRAMFGTLGTRNVLLNADSINVDVFDNTFNGNVELLSPSVKLTMQNSFGIPISFDIKNIIGLKEMTVLPLSGAALSAPLNPYTLNAPAISQRGQSVSSSLSLTSTNSNLVQLISSLPTYLSYQFSLVLNPNGPVKNFVQDDSKVKVIVDLELPFHGKASNLVLTREYDFDGLGVDDAGDTKIKLKTVNETPLDAYIQVYFASSTGTIIDSLFTDRSILKGAPVDANGFTQTSATVTKEVALTNAKVDRINQAKKLLVVGSIFTSANGTVPVKLTATDKLKIAIGVSSKLEYTLN